MTRFFLATALIATLGLFQGSLRAEEAEHGEAGEAVKIPDTLTGVWQEILEHKLALDSTIKASKLADVHKVAFAIRDLVKALPDKSKDLPADKLQRVQSGVKQVEKLASELDKTGDAGDQAATEANAKKLDGVLKLIEAQYPAGTVPAKTASVAYTCPMHPEVSSNELGKCPKCGMALVEKK